MAHDQVIFCKYAKKNVVVQSNEISQVAQPIYTFIGDATYPYKNNKQYFLKQIAVFSTRIIVKRFRISSRSIWPQRKLKGMIRNVTDFFVCHNELFYVFERY